jgi:hypothetical protein
MAVIAVTKERKAGETRVAATPETVKKLIGAGFELVVETGAGLGASISDADYEAAGARIVKTAKDAIGKADVLFKVRAPEADEVKALKSGAYVVALLNAFNEKATVEALAKQGAGGQPPRSRSRAWAPSSSPSRTRNSPTPRPRAATRRRCRRNTRPSRPSWFPATSPSRTSSSPRP